MRKLANVLREVWLLLGITLLWLVGLEIAARVAFAARDVWRTGGDARLSEWSLGADVYRDQAWAREYWREEDLTSQTTFANWHSYVYWRRKPYQGKYINIDANGLRKTWNRTSVPTPTQIKIFMFGGSAMWGTGARDEFTIPSWLSKKLQERNVDVWVTNFGEGGYVSTQEVIALMLELQKGNVPDVVIFYDGANDVFSAFQQGVAGLPQNEYNRVQSFNQLNWRGEIVEKLALYRAARGLVLAVQGRPLPKDDARLAEAVMDVYFSNQRIVSALAQEYGFTAHFYWQPTIYTKPRLSAWEMQERNRYGEAEFFQRAYRALAQRLQTLKPTNVYDLSDAFDDEAGTVFIDAFHISEAGNARIADLMIQMLPLSSRQNLSR
jgi:lysophospholipase L1-like esterase